MAAKLPLVLKTLVALALAGALIAAAMVWFRPTAVVAPVERGRAVSAVPGSVVVEAEYTMDVKSEIGGRIAFSALDPGKRFAEGEVLLRIDTTDVDLEIARVQSEFETAKQRIEIGSAVALELASARDTLAQLERQARLGSLSESELTRRRREVQQIEQRLALEEVANRSLLENYENTLKVKQRQREKMTVTAPFDGVVSEVLARTGDLIGGGAPIARLISTSRTVEARISEENFAGIRIGQPASVRFLGYGVQLYEATVTKILPTADPETQRYIVHLEVDLALEQLVPGLTGEVSIVVGARDHALNIPRRALFGNHVWAVRGGVVELREVKVGFTSLNHVEILDGLTDGDQVIVERLDTFREGDRVRTTVASGA